MSSDAGEPVSCVKVTPEQFRIEVVLNEEVFLELLLTNTSNDLCTFKVKTTARDRYLLRPTQDYIQPHSSRVCKIVMSALRTYPDLSNPKNLKDKFLVQATTLEREVPDLTKMWKDLETQHNPKAGIYKYAETKIKCKLSIPAKYRAADATKRGLEEEALAAAAADKGAEQAQQQQQQPQSLSQQQMQSRMNDVSAEDEFAAMVLAPTSEPAHVTASAQPAAPAASAPTIVATSSSNAPTQPSSSSSAALPNAAPSSSSSATSAAAVSGSNSSNGHAEGSAPPSLAHQLKASEAKYAELMAFIVQTTQELEKERLDKEGAEARAQQAAQQLAQGLARLESTEAKLLQAREELKRAAAESARKNGGAGADDGSEGGADGVTRRRGKDGEDDDSRTGKKLSPAAIAAAAASTSPSALSSASSSAASSPRTATKSPPGLSLAFWQIALLALVCFVLGKIFG